jgi:hypothetical protein
MNQLQLFQTAPQPFAKGPFLRVREIRNRLKRGNVIRPVPDPRTLVKLIQDGTLDGFRSEFGYGAFEYSVNAMIERLRKGERIRQFPNEEHDEPKLRAVG